MAFLLTRFLFFLLLLPFFVALAQNNGTVRVGDSLTAGDDNARWLSPSDDFAFGFQPLDNDHFSVAIWYYKIKIVTIVWYAMKEDKPALAPKRSRLELTADNGLVLKDSQGKGLWKSDLTTNTNPVAHAVMNETGNFVVVSESAQTIWESFKHPRDTLLPTQIMEIECQLSSRLKENDFSTGRFQFRMLSDGDAVLNTINLPSKQAYDAYYVSGTRDGANPSNSGYRVVFDPSGYLATLNFDGVFTLSYYPKTPTTNTSWSILSPAIPDNICNHVGGELGTGPCGYNSICTLTDDQRPSCKCPTGYSPFDPSDEYSGCKPDYLGFCDTFPVSTGKSQQLEDHVKLLPVPNTNWPTSDYELFKPYSLEDCKQACLIDCLCAVVVHNSAGHCRKKKLPLSNGREDRQLSSTVFIKLSNSTRPRDTPPHLEDKKEQSNALRANTTLHTI
ncbi:Bulb-type lectin domain containing protein [Trema orientale]|uniref:Bulb-type lectin domain containing protein n=1 Tax=Trema orientale TaxID=63057 RepID=A0A2P5FU18_TREOI|nr:Bulb-type lectin domain containing protein [Trema orientale]